MSRLYDLTIDERETHSSLKTWRTARSSLIKQIFSGHLQYDDDRGMEGSKKDSLVFLKFMA